MSIISSFWLRRLLGIERIIELRDSFSRASQHPANPSLGNGILMLSVLIALLPAASAYLTDLSQSLDVTTVAVGIAACLGMIVRSRRGLKSLVVLEWAKSMRLTHTAFALGCIPAVILLIVSPTSLYNIGTYSHGQNEVQQQVSQSSMVWFILKVAVWAGVTEECIFRGLVVSVARRWQGLSKQIHRDIFAVLLSAIIFGVGHLNSWGPGMSLALVGIGIGLAVAYIAIEERLIPVIIYHAVFDMLSLGFAIFSFRAGG